MVNHSQKVNSSYIAIVDAVSINFRNPREIVAWPRLHHKNELCYYVPEKNELDEFKDFYSLISMTHPDIGQIKPMSSLVIDSLQSDKKPDSVVSLFSANKGGYLCMSMNNQIRVYEQPEVLGRGKLPR